MVYVVVKETRHVSKSCILQQRKQTIRCTHFCRGERQDKGCLFGFSVAPNTKYIISLHSLLAFLSLGYHLHTLLKTVL